MKVKICFWKVGSTNLPIPIITVIVMLAKCCHASAKCGMLPEWQGYTARHNF
jgi:hypothetical protein